MDKIERVKLVLQEAGLSKIRAQGVNVWACCPYHEENSPSFRMHEDGYYFCFGCKSHGGLYKFLFDHLDLNFNNAQAWLKRFKIEFDPSSLNKIEDEYDKLHAPVVETTIRDSMLGQYAYCPEYMLARGFRQDILREFEVGYNFQTSRVTIPLRDIDGGLVGVTERSTNKEDRHRYIHPRIYSEHLYLLHRFTKEPWLPVFEGQLKSLWTWQERRVPSISSMSSNLTHDQARLLSGTKQGVILFFDGDGPGAKGTDNALRILAEHGLTSKVRVAWPYPAGKDQPDELTEQEFFTMLDNSISPPDFQESLLLTGTFV